MIILGVFWGYLYFWKHPSGINMSVGWFCDADAFSVWLSFVKQQNPPVYVGNDAPSFSMTMSKEVFLLSRWCKNGSTY